MATEAKELERVRGIHKMARVYLGNINSCWVGTQIFYMTEGVTWSREELLAWPERLKTMQDELTRRTYPVDIAYAWYADAASWAHHGASYASPRWHEAIARGLCLYREQLTDEQPAAVVEPRNIHAGPTAAQVREAYPNVVKPVDRYEQHRLIMPSEETQRAGTDMLDLSSKRRERLVANLRRELDRPISLAEQPHPREWFSGHVRRYR